MSKYPIVWENKEGDILEVIVKDSPSPGYGEWINQHLTLMRDHETDEIVGFSIEGIRYLLKLAKETEKEAEEMSDEEVEELYKTLEEMGLKREGDDNEQESV